ncbi:MAG: hypothetical protein SV201_06900 [Pseudomonadota bacterium]|nr:hypothetical protein [Pseudomonadota bacterium]
MRQHPHKLAGIFPDTTSLAEAEKLFLDEGFSREQVNRIQAGEAEREQEQKIESESGGVRNEFIRDISVGTGVGGVGGAIGAAGIGLGLPALYVSAPVVAPLMVIGYAATIGGLAGAVRGLHVKEDVLTAVVEDALHNGYPVLMVHTSDKSETEKAHELMESTMQIKEVSA